MGQSEEKSNVENYSKSKEGKSIIDIGKSTLEQNIYICGNYNINFFTDNIVEPLSYPQKPNINNYSQMARHKDIKEWHFFFSPKKKI